MFGVAVLDVVIGLSFVYLVLSLACTALKELLESVRRTRASNLRKGIEALLMDRSGVGLADQLYQHALIEGLCKKKNKFPTYIPARNFALALLDIVARKTVDPPSMGSREGATVGASPAAMALSSDAGVLAPLRSKVSAASDLKPVRDALLPLIDDARGDVERLRRNVEEWFDNGMDRAAGWYKRRTQWWVFGIGFGLAVLLNADTIAIVRALSLDPKVRDAVVNAAETYLETRVTTTPSAVPTPIAASSAVAPPESVGSEKEILPTTTPTPSPLPHAPTVTDMAAQREGSPTPTPTVTGTPALGEDFRRHISGPLDQVKKLGVLGVPVGWSRDRSPISDESWPQAILGWFLTAVAVSLGAPFWFDTLNKLVVVRSTVKPKEKSPEEASKDRTLKSTPASAPADGDQSKGG